MQARELSLRVLMDDLILKVLKWPDMDFWAEKFHCIEIVRGKSMNTTPLFATKPSSPSDFSNYIPSTYSQ